MPTTEIRDPYEYLSRDEGKTRIAVDWTDLDERGCVPVAEEILRELLTQAGYFVVDPPSVPGEDTTP